MIYRLQIKLIGWLVASLPPGDFKADLSAALTRACNAEIGRIDRRLATLAETQQAK